MWLGCIRQGIITCSYRNCCNGGHQNTSNHIYNCFKHSAIEDHPYPALTHFFFQTTSICTVHYTFCTASTFMSCSEVMPTRCQKKQPEHLDYPLLKGQKNLRSWWERQNQSWRDKIKRSHPGQCTHVGFLSTTKNQDYLWANQLHDCYI